VAPLTERTIPRGSDLKLGLHTSSRSPSIWCYKYQLELHYTTLQPPINSSIWHAPMFITNSSDAFVQYSWHCRGESAETDSPVKVKQVNYLPASTNQTGGYKNSQHYRKMQLFEAFELFPCFEHHQTVLPRSTTVLYDEKCQFVLAIDKATQFPVVIALLNSMKWSPHFKQELRQAAFYRSNLSRSLPWPEYQYLRVVSRSFLVSQLNCALQSGN
jgi:hypothetical protein